MGPQRLPVNKTALSAGVTVPPDWRLSVTGAVERELSLSLADLRAINCYYTARAALAALVGLSVLFGVLLSMALDFVPVVGTVKGIIEAITGKDLITGQELAWWERLLGVVPVLGGLTALAAISKISRAADDVADIGRGVDDPFGDYDEELLRGCFDLVRPFKDHFVTDLDRSGRGHAPPPSPSQRRQGAGAVELETCAEPRAHLDEWSASTRT